MSRGDVRIDDGCSSETVIGRGEDRADVVAEQDDVGDVGAVGDGERGAGCGDGRRA